MSSRRYRRVNVGWRNQESATVPRWWWWWWWRGGGWWWWLETENTIRTVLWACRSLDVSPAALTAARSWNVGMRESGALVCPPVDFTWTDVLQTLQAEVSSCLFFHWLMFMTSLGWFCAQRRKKSNDDCWCRHETRWSERREMALCSLNWNQIQCRGWHKGSDQT